jgi:hypothetical protein
MSSYAAPRCRHIKVNGTQCGSPALRDKKFCFYHQGARPWPVECYSEDKYATGDVILPYFEDAHSIQAVVRRVMEMVLQKRIEQKTASLLLYALQIASSNLKRMELEKPQPEQIVTDFETEHKIPIAALPADETVAENSASDSSAHKGPESAPPHQKSRDEEEEENLPPGTIQACHRPDRRSVVFRGSLDHHCSGVTLASQVLMAVTALRTTASAKEQKYRVPVWLGTEGEAITV